MQTDEALILLVRDNVRRLRHQAGMTGTEAAARSGMQAQRWWRIESGKFNITMETLAKLSVGLGVDAEELFREPPKESPSRRRRTSSASGSRTTSAGSGARAISRSSKPRTPRGSTDGTGTR